MLHEAAVVFVNVHIICTVSTDINGLACFDSDLNFLHALLLFLLLLLAMVLAPRTSQSTPCQYD